MTVMMNGYQNLYARAQHRDCHSERSEESPNRSGDHTDYIVWRRIG